MTVVLLWTTLWLGVRGRLAAVNPIIDALIDGLAGHSSLASIRIPENVGRYRRAARWTH
jgi:hypothetical protein